MGQPVRSRAPEATSGRSNAAGRYLLRTVEAVVLEWGALGAGAGAVPVELRCRLEELVAAGVDVAVVAPDATAADVQARLLADARGPGALLLAARDGVFVVGVSGTRALRRGPPPRGGDGLSGEVRAVLARRGTTPALTLTVTTGGGTADHSHLLGLLDEQLWRRRGGRAPDIDEDPAWVVVADTDDDVGRRVTDALFTLADGMLGTRGACAEASRVGARLVQVAGVYTGRGPAERLLPGPWWPAARVTGGPDAERRVLDLRSGLLLHERTRHGADGVARQREVRLASAASPRLLAMRLEGPAHAVALEPPSEPTLAADQWSRAGDDAGRGVAVLVRDRTRDEGGLRTVERLATYATHLDAPDDEEVLRARLDRAAARGFDAALRDHRRAWARRWEAVDVEIPGDPGLQLAARLALFHLWGLATREDEAAVGARGLSGTGYRGHVFWDADVFVMPALVTLSPRSARAMLTYRLRRLPRAREAARALGREGARFPWESAEDGSDVTPRWIRVGRERVAVRTGEQEEHVVADVAWAADHYAAWSGDGAWLRGPGSALVVEAARYWASRCRVDGDGVAHVDGVIGPDEYHEDVDDDAFTNVMARWNLRRAADLVEDLDGSSAEAAAWRRLADRLADGYDPATGVYEQHRGYHRLEPLTAEALGRVPVAADLVLPPERLHGSQIIKQPDVLMLHHLVPDEVAPGSLRPNLDLYHARTAHGSSLSPAVSASLLARAGRHDEAVALLRTALRIDLDDLTGATPAGLHVAAQGGAWQALVHGFAGMRVRAGALHVEPAVPADWEGFRLRLRCLGRRVSIRVEGDRALLSTDGPLPLWEGSRRRLVDGEVALVRGGDGWTRGR